MKNMKISKHEHIEYLPAEITESDKNTKVDIAGISITVHPEDTIADIKESYENELKKEYPGKISVIDDIWEGLYIANFTKEGQIAARVGREMIDKIIKKHEFGFGDGGCLIFAEGIKKAFSESGKEAELAAIVTVRDGEKFLDHILVRTKINGVEVFIDSDGAATEDDMLEKFIKYDGAIGTVYEIDKLPNPLERYINSIPVDEEISDLIYKEAKKLIGNPKIMPMDKIQENKENLIQKP